MSLDLLRRDPVSAIQSYSYYFDAQSISLDFGKDIGVPVRLYEGGVFSKDLLDGIKACITVRVDNIYNESPEEGSDTPDFFFPYCNDENLIGHVAVSETCEPGTVVFTGGMNGCALDVRYDAKNSRYLFYHDKNGTHEYLIPTGEGITKVCRIEGDDYWDADKMLAISNIDHYPLIQFICVKRATHVWAVLSCGVFIGRHGVAGAFRPVIPKDSVKACFRGYFSKDVPLMSY